jgi:NADH-quinone oxidoreductase subunit G
MTTAAVPKEVTLTIDERPAKVPPGTTILEAAKSVGVRIPHFCYHKCLSIAANCRMCLVEVEKSPKLVPACHGRVAEGMVVRTTTPKVKKAQQAVMEFLFINHPVDCPICDQAGECKLQDYFMEFQKQLSRFREEKEKKAKAQAMGPHIVYDAERCILCTRCVRFMAEIARDPQLAPVERGDCSHISTAPGRKLDHPYSLNTVEICPVGALTSREFRFKMRTWFLSSADSICAGCSRCCSVVLQHHQGTAHRYLARENPLVNDSWLCDDGRLSYRRINDHRLKDPAERKGEEMLMLAYDDAVKQAGQTLLEDMGSIGVAVSPQVTCEDAFALMRFCTDILGVREIHLTGRADWAPDNLLKRTDANPNRRGLSEIAAALGVKVLDVHALIKAAQTGAFETLLAVGGDVPDDIPDILDLKKFETVIVLAERTRGIFEVGDLAIPLAVHAEQDGTMVNADGLVQRVRPMGRQKNRAVPGWKALSDVAGRMDREFRFAGPAAVFAALAEAVPFFGGMSHASIPARGAWGAGIVPPERKPLCTPR